MQATQLEERNLVGFVEDLKQQWLETIDALIDPLMLVDKDYKIIRSNLAMARVTDLPVTDVVGKTCYKIFASRDTPCPECAMQKAISNKSTRNWEMQIGERFYEVTSQPLKNSKEEVTGTVQIYHDRTETKTLQDKIMQQEKLASIGLLSSGVAHEINNPLGGILAFAQILLKELDKDSPHYQDVVEIEAATQRCKAIVSSLLEFARNRGATEGDRRSSVSAVEAFKAALNFAKVSFNTNTKVIEDYQGGDIVVFGDRNKLIQVFLNLIQNAAHAMLQGGTLTLTAHTEIDEETNCKYGLFSISDTGIGIPQEHIKRIFEPFFTTRQPGDGTGLGLAICYGIIKDHDGSLNVSSVLNKGSTFTVRLPLVREKVKLTIQK